MTHAKEILAENINELQVEIFFHQGVMGSMGFMVLKKGESLGKIKHSDWNGFSSS